MSISSDDEPSDTSGSDQPRVPLQRRQELERILRTNPTNLEAFTELAAIYRNENRPVEAKRILKQALGVFPENEDLMFLHEEAVLARSLQQYREVSDLATRLDTPETDRELSRATRDWAMRRIDVCKARLKRDPSANQLYVQLAEAHLDAEQYDASINALGPVVSVDEFAPAAYLLIARCQLAEGQDLEAMTALRACAMRRAVVAPLPIRVMALRLLCDCASRLGLAETLANYQTALAAAESELAKLRSNTQLPPPAAPDATGNLAPHNPVVS